MGKIIVGEPTNDEVEVWTVSMPVITFLPFSRRFRKDMQYVESLEGFIGFHQIFPHGTLCLFDSENNAKGARNMMRFQNIRVGKNICPVYIHKDYLAFCKDLLRLRNV